MKKNSAYVLMVPGFVLLLLFLMLPLCSILWPTIFTNGLSLNQYISFFQDEYYLEIFLSNAENLLDFYLGLYTIWKCQTAYFISRCSTKWKGLLIAISIFPLLTNSVVRSFAWINILGKNGGY